MTDTRGVQTGNPGTAPAGNRSHSIALRYVGERYSNAGFPVEMLTDLTALRDLVAALAKQEFLRRHPDHAEVPAGFDEAISFSLVEIDEGSALPVLDFDSSIARRNLPGICDGIEVIVRGVIAGVPIIFDEMMNGVPRDLPEDAIAAMIEFGAKLRDNERVEIQGGVDTTGKVASLDFHRRKRLLGKIHLTHTKEFNGVGKLTGVDLAGGSMSIQTKEYGELRLPLKNVFEFADGMLGDVEFSILIAFDVNDGRWTVQEVRSVNSDPAKAPEQDHEDLSVKQAAAVLFIDPHRVIDLIRENAIPSRMVEGDIRLPVRELMIYMVNRDEKCREALHELSALSEELGLYDLTRDEAP